MSMHHGASATDAHRWSRQAGSPPVPSQDERGDRQRGVGRSVAMRSSAVPRQHPAVPDPRLPAAMPVGSPLFPGAAAPWTGASSAPPGGPAGGYLPGFEPFRWLREYPPDMFDGLMTRLRRAR
jgi:hypothetical protein